MVIDLAGTTFVDPSILAALLDAGRRTQARGRQGFAMSLPDDAAPAVRRVIDVTGLEAALRFRPERGRRSRPPGRGDRVTGRGLELVLPAGGRTSPSCATPSPAWPRRWRWTRRRSPT